ncbi:MAG: hypothetical protein R3E66_21810 [bacterium]
MPSQIQGLTDRPDDRDVYRILAADHPRTVSVAFEPVQGVTQILRMFDSERLADPLASLQFSGTQGEQGGIPAYRVEAGATAFIVVTTTGGFDRKAPYRLALGEVVDLADSVEVEPNDRMPIPMAVPGTLRGGFYAAEDVDRITLGVVVPPAPAAETPPRTADAGTVQPHEDAGLPDGGVPYTFRSKPIAAPPLLLKVEAMRDEDVIGVTLNLPSGERTMVLDASKRDATLCVPAFVPGDAEVVLRPVQMSSAGGLAYAINATLLQGPQIENEPNDELADADELASSRTGFFDDGSADIYGVRVQDPLAHVVITLKDAPSLEGMELVDEAGALVATASVGRIEVDLPAGMYFVSLRGRPECLPYTLSVQRKPSDAANGER